MLKTFADALRISYEGKDEVGAFDVVHIPGVDEDVVFAYELDG